MFKRLDEAGDEDGKGTVDGKICKKELDNLGDLGNNECPPKNILKNFDKDGDGCLNLKEFYKFYKECIRNSTTKPTKSTTTT